MATVLLVGGGGREHAMAWAISKSDHVKHIFVCPGNPGIASVPKVSLLPSSHMKTLPAFCKENNVSLVAIGPEAPLASGLSDELLSYGVPVFGPTRKAAEIEASKAFSKEFMARHNIPTASFKVFDDYEAAKAHVEQTFDPRKGLVIKVSGLAAGKGVVLPSSLEESINTLKEFMVDKIFGDAGSRVVIEDLLVGEEVSCLAFTDGFTISMCPPAQDHKRIFDNDQGPNTGGMGAYCPAPILTSELKEMVLEKILKPAVDGMRKEGTPFVGVLYAGVMICPNQPIPTQTLEFNCRFGDPETQCILPMLKSDLYTIMKACAEHCLDSVNVEWAPKGSAAVAVVVASEGYPKKSATPQIIEIKSCDDESSVIFHAGTSESENKELLASGGRVLAITGISELGLKEALKKAYKRLEDVHFKGMQYRKDIAQKAFKSKDAAFFNDLQLRASERFLGSEEKCAMVNGSFSASVDGGVLTYSTNIVGSKSRFFHKNQRLESLGVDTARQSFNDSAAFGSVPKFLTATITMNSLDHLIVDTVKTGMAKACIDANCQFVGLETQVIPGRFQHGEFQLCGSAIGLVNSRVESSPQEGDVIIGLSSMCINSGGFFTTHKALENTDLNTQVLGTQKSILEALSTPEPLFTALYLKLVADGVQIKAASHIKLGFIDSISKLAGESVSIEINRGSWPVSELTNLVQKSGDLSDEFMENNFNMGLGFLLAVPSSEVSRILDYIKNGNYAFSGFHVGRVVRRDSRGPVIFCGKILNQAISRTVRIGVLGSTRGTDLQAVIDAIESKELDAEIKIVISNKSDSYILERASKHSIPSLFISGKDKTRDVFDAEVSSVLETLQVDLVVLIGYMRILSVGFVRRWENRIINVHPSLLPEFAGGMDLNVHQAVLDAKVKRTGCTVHLVDEGVDSGLILVQKACDVLENDTSDSLKDRVQALEGLAIIEAIRMFVGNEILVPMV